MTKLRIQSGISGKASTLRVRFADGPVTDNDASLCEACVLVFADLVDLIEPQRADMPDGPLVGDTDAHNLRWTALQCPADLRWLRVLVLMFQHMPLSADVIELRHGLDGELHTWDPGETLQPDLEQHGIVDERMGDAAMLEFEFGRPLAEAERESLEEIIDTWIAVGALGGFADPMTTGPSRLLPHGGLEFSDDLAWMGLASAPVDDLAYEALSRMVASRGGVFAGVRMRIE